MSQKVSIKRGDTFVMQGAYTDGNGAAIDLSSYTIQSEMVLDDERVALTATVLDAANGIYSLSLTATQTAELTVGVYSCDIEYQVGGVVSSTDVFRISVKEDVTNAN